MTDGLDVFVQLVIAAITTWPCSSVTSLPSASVHERAAPLCTFATAAGATSST